MRRIGNSNRDDLLDAIVRALTVKVGDGGFERVRDHVKEETELVLRDREGLLMQIVYVSHCMGYSETKKFY